MTETLKNEMSDLNNAEYKIHAVFHHEGGANFGHYWVYIYDDKAEVPRWLKYSDDTVSEVGVVRLVYHVIHAYFIKHANTFQLLSSTEFLISLFQFFHDYRHRRMKCSMDTKDRPLVFVCTCVQVNQMLFKQSTE